MSTQLLHKTDDSSQDLLRTVLLEVLLQDALPQKVPNVPPLVKEEVQRRLNGPYVRIIRKDRAIPSPPGRPAPDKQAGRH